MHFTPFRAAATNFVFKEFKINKGTSYITARSSPAFIFTKSDLRKLKSVKIKTF